MVVELESHRIPAINLANDRSMVPMDVYQNYAELIMSEKEGRDFVVSAIRREGSNCVILAPHGGAIEPGTSEVATEVAQNDLSLYLFEGLKPEGNRRLHITSTNFDEPGCMRLVQASDTVVAIHGEASLEPVVFLGGRDTALGRHFKQALVEHGYQVSTHRNANLHGLAAENICNRGCRGKGVQLELSRGLRQMFFPSLTAEGRKNPTAAFADFTLAIRDGLQSACGRA